ncbi:uncharacterized protein PV09_09173 [Verruconis gallopava]|uniref:Zn(2)-C6 fungal-type domain-containing protein n=1 Tax=Verruconis gallopava TaxID=253628 RepID=A0A0D1ZXG3_9PEZI|nr:uncharacterized protein PV09_09173 [Verruconis gallopava]KIV99142.1 hypothetical protein PV09_09173 [Verruconis gallopava]
MKQHDVPPPRRKSCSACVKAKRRCDMLLPQCTRCFQKKANCVYNGQAPRDRRPASMSATTATTTAVVIASSASASCAAVPFSINRLTDPLPVTLEVPDLDFHAATFELHDSDNADFGFSSFVPCLPVPPCPASFPAQHSMRLDDRSIQIYTHDDYSHVEDICDEFNVGQLNDDTSRIACAVAAIRNWHRCMAFSCSTPFLHRKLYSHDRPNLISDVFASCLMYATKTAQTEDVVVPLIENKACALIIEYSRHQVSPTLSLARVQALLLYLSIREAHYVERDLPILETWLASLASLRDQSLQVSLDSFTPSCPADWSSWIFWECVSRTILAASFFINVHCLIARGQHPLGEWTRPHIWTASKRLWNADTSQGFFDTWRLKKPIAVCNIFIKDLLENGDGDEVDAFTSMLLVPCLGLTNTKQWINNTRGRTVEDLDGSASDMPSA